MRTKLAVLVVLLVLMTGMAAQADLSWFGLIGTGTDQAAVNARMSLRTTSGSPIGSNDYVVPVPQGEGLRAQLIFAGDGGPSRYSVEWSLEGAPSDKGWQRAPYEDAGWMINIPSSSLYLDVDTPFHIRVKDLRGKSGYVRLLFVKIGTGRRAVAANEALLIRVEVPAPPTAAQAVQPQSSVDAEAVNRNFEEIGAAVSGLNANDQKLTDALNNNGQRDDQQDARLARLEQWASQLTTSQEPATATVTNQNTRLSYKEQFLAKYAGQDVWVFVLSEQSPMGEARYTFWQQTTSGWAACQNQLVVRPGNEMFLFNGRLSNWSAFGLSGVTARTPSMVFKPTPGVHVVILSGGE